MKVERGTILWSVPAHILFGVQNFLIGYTNTLDVDAWAVIGGLWLTAGLIGLAVALYFYRHGLFYTDEPLLDDAKASVEISTFVKLVTVFGGLCVGFSQLMMKGAFALAPAETGPLCAVISSDVIIISTVCHFVYHEYLNRWQAGAIVLIVSGLGIMANASSQSTPDGGSVGNAMLAFALATVGMVSFACAILAIRVGCIGRLAAWSGFVVRMLVLLLIGSIALVYSVQTNGWPNASWVTMAVPVVAGFSQAGGVLCVNNALQYPNTGVSNAIFASNSVFVLVLQAIVFGELPNRPGLIGMACVVVGVISMSLLEDQESESQDLTSEDSGLLRRSSSTGKIGQSAAVSLDIATMGGSRSPAGPRNAQLFAPTVGRTASSRSIGGA